jgi:hypothetical protein
VLNRSVHSKSSHVNPKPIHHAGSFHYLPFFQYYVNGVEANVPRT